MKGYKAIRVLLLIGAITMLGGFVSGERLYRNALVHGLVDIVDIKDESCQKATVATGSSCPMGCRAMPLAGPELSGRAPECRSVLWVATCGIECDARGGLIRLDDGSFLESGAFIIRLEEPPEGFRDEFTLMGVELKTSTSGLWRYRALYDNPEDDLRTVEKMESRIRTLPYVTTIERIIK